MPEAGGYRASQQDKDRDCLSFLGKKVRAFFITSCGLGDYVIQRRRYSDVDLRISLRDSAIRITAAKDAEG